MTLRRVLFVATALSLPVVAAKAQPSLANESGAGVAAVAAPEIVVVGEGRNRMSIPGSSSVIDEEDLARSRPLTINEALRQAPGLFPRDEEGLGLRPNIGVRGLSPTRSSKVLQLEDGVPLAYAPYGDNASYSQPPFRRFVRIETLKSASQVRFGPNTVGGVINYITPRAPESLSGDALIAVGDRGYREVDVKIGGPLSDDWRVIGHANLTQFDGVRDNHALETSDLWAKLEGAAAPGHDISVRVGLANEDSQVTYSGLTAAEFAANPRQNAFRNDVFFIERATAALSHRWTLSDGLTLSTTAYSLWFDRDWWRQSSNSSQRPNDASDPLCAGMSNLLTTCGNEGRLREYNTYGLETRLVWSGELFGADAEIEGGLRRHEERQMRVQVNGDTPTARTPGTSVNGGVREANLRYADATSGHIATRFTWGALNVSPGVRFETIDYERVNLLSGVKGKTELSETIPGVGFSYQFGENAFVYGGLHRGFAPPRVEDIIGAAGGVVELDPERSVNLELGWRAKPQLGLFFDVAYFRMDFDNQIVPASIAGGVGASLTNAGETRHQGLELALNGSLRDMGFMQNDDVFFRAALTYLGEAKFIGRRTSNVSGFSGVSVSGNRLPYTPEWIASAAVGYAFGAAGEIQFEIVHTGEQFTDDLNTTAQTADGQRGKIGASTIANLTLTWRPVNDNVSLYLAAKNVTDELYIVDRSRGILPGAPRLVQAGVTLSF